MTVFAVRKSVVKALMADSAWAEKAFRCRSLEDLQRVVVEFSRAKGFKVAEVPKVDYV